MAIDDVAIHAEVVLSERQAALFHFLGAYLDGESIDFANLLRLPLRVHRLGYLLHLGTEFFQVCIDLTLNLHLHDDISEGVTFQM